MGKGREKGLIFLWHLKKIQIYTEWVKGEGEKERENHLLWRVAWGWAPFPGVGQLRQHMDLEHRPCSPNHCSPSVAQ